ncbi:MAG TPA: (Fe-S)-binding protein [Candidatus Korarchaeota archaeon]|nr:(Fe-S)-binding protein [Candidatus Korarchaeota archaeon]
MVVEFHRDLIKELGRCIGCGACNIPCPTFHIEDLRETEGARARVKLLSMLGYGRMELTEEFLSYIFTCMNCGLCSQYCPAGIDVFGVIIDSRSSLIDMGYVPLVTVDMRDAKRRTGSPIGEGLTKGVWLPPDFQPEKGADVLFFAGCWVHTVPEVAMSMNKILQKISPSVTPAGPSEPCCGGLTYVIGERDSADESKERLRAFINSLSPKRVVSGCSLCAGIFPDLQVQYFSSFVEGALNSKVVRLKSLKGKKNKIFLVPSCRSDGASRRILESIKNAIVLETPDWVCCDCGATLIYQADPDKFDRWFRKITEIASDMDADYLVIEEVACYSMISNILEGKNKYKGMKIISFPSFLADHIS